ncbi:MAG: hypothetical protein ACRCTZ_19555 [Sarcina sp.]
MALFVTKQGARKKANDIDRLLKEIDQVTQSKIDRVCDKIDGELNSCGRELENSIRTLQQIDGLLEKLVNQIGVNAPQHVQVLVESIASEISSKVAVSMDNQGEVRKNIADIDQYTNEIDQLTNEIDVLTNKIDKLTDTFQD